MVACTDQSLAVVLQLRFFFGYHGVHLSRTRTLQAISVRLVMLCTYMSRATVRTRCVHKVISNQFVNTT